MTSEEKIQYFRNMTREELEKVLDEEEKYTERDIIIASIELGRKDKAEGRYYTTEEVMENIFETIMEKNNIFIENIKKI